MAFRTLNDGTIMPPEPALPETPANSAPASMLSAAMSKVAQNTAIQNAAAKTLGQSGGGADIVVNAPKMLSAGTSSIDPAKLFANIQENTAQIAADGKFDGLAGAPARAVAIGGKRTTKKHKKNGGRRKSKSKRHRRSSRNRRNKLSRSRRNISHKR